MSPTVTKEPAVPVLRFPAFSEEWEAATISAIADKITDGTHDTPKPTDEGIPYLTAIHVKDGFIDFENCYYLPEEEHRKIYARCNPEYGDLLMVNIGAGTATSAMVDVNYEFSLKNVALIKPDRDLVDPRFFTQFQRFHSARLRHQLSSGGAQPFLSLRQIGKLKIEIAPLPEQRKIADFLTAVDGRIWQLIHMNVLLRDYKKGVMQQLFTQAIRFKDEHGNDFADWEEKRYDSVYSFKNTNSYSRDLLCYEGGEVRNIHYGDIHTKFKSNFVLQNELVPFIKPEVDLIRISKECYCREGDLVIADASEDYNDIGKCIEIRDLGGERTLAGLHTFIARPKKDAIAQGFGGYLMQAREVRLKIMTIAQGAKVLGISKRQLCKVLLPIPSPDEQTKIAEFLTAIDHKIDSVATQITEIQTFKKGLLQQMFV